MQRLRRYIEDVKGLREGKGQYSPNPCTRQKLAPFSLIGLRAGLFSSRLVSRTGIEKHDSKRSGSHASLIWQGCGALFCRLLTLRPRPDPLLDDEGIAFVAQARTYDSPIKPGPS